MRVRPACLVVGQLVALALFSGCTGAYESDFPIVVANRAANAIQVLANGSGVGEVPPGQTGNFSLKLKESNPNILSNGVAPTPQAEVALSARDVRTGAVSSTQSLTLSQNVPMYVTFTPADFPSTGPTIARFTF